MKRLALFVACLIALLALSGLLAWADQARANVKVSTARPSDYWRPGAPGVRVSTGTVAIPTYPYHACLDPEQDGLAGVSYQRLDWGCLEQSGPARPHTYTLVMLSNEFLTATLLPELGGRIYELFFKPTGHNQFYRNPVIKPTPWGPPEQGWWLAAGGMEWGFPTDEHGYEWGVPWQYHIVRSAAGVTVTLRDTDVATRPVVSVAVHLPANRAALLIQPKIFNPTDEVLDIKYWTNVQLAPGLSNTVGPDLQFLFPTEEVHVHSTGDPDLPAAGALMSWPLYGGRDYSRLGNWDEWLGFFEAPQGHGPFAGVYDAVADEGVVRVYPAAVVRGSKGFAFGFRAPLPSYLWTDDASSYVEVHGGVAPTFADTVPVAPGQALTWREVWYPVAGIGGLSAADATAALRLERVGEALAIGLYTPVPQEHVDLYLWREDCTVLGHWSLAQVGPAHPFTDTLPVQGPDAGQVSLVAFSSTGELLGAVNPRDCLPPVAGMRPLPAYTTIPTISLQWSGSDVGSGVAAYDLQYRAGYEGLWTDWLTGTSELSTTFAGVDGETYFFRVRAYDQAGNASSQPDEEWGQTFTSVLLTPSPVLLTSRKLAHPLEPALGQRVQYHLSVRNTGNLTATTVALTDHVPGYLGLITDSLAAGLVSGTLRLPWGDLVQQDDMILWRGMMPPGRELDLAYALVAMPATPAGVNLTNTFWLTADGLELIRRWAGIVYRRLYFLPVLSKQTVHLRQELRVKGIARH